MCTAVIPTLSWHRSDIWVEIKGLPYVLDKKHVVLSTVAWLVVLTEQVLMLDYPLLDDVCSKL